MKIFQIKFALSVMLLMLSTSILKAQNQLKWPEITQQNKPWTRWWWEGSAVDTSNLHWILDKYQKAGLGGVEVTVIYGVKGQEDKFINFLSPKWVDRFTYTLNQAKKLDLGVDMAQASGWPFGGPWIKDADASKYVAYQSYDLKGGEQLKTPILFEQKALLRQEGSVRSNMKDMKEPVTANADLQKLAIDQIQYAKTLYPLTVMAYSDQGEKIDLSDKLTNDHLLNWTAPAGNWKIYALFQGLHGKMVERAGPGGEGYAIDHFSKKATDDFLHRFDEAFQGRDISHLRAFFNDSYEVDDARGEADWTPNFLAEFQKKRGYDLRDQLPALFGLSPNQELNSRVLTDYRETISDLLLENYTEEWHKWAHEKGKLIRNQAHGSPANILDLYAATDIPETEGTDILRIKFASSAAHVTGKPLASSESATWENEHFLSKLGDVKVAMDRYLLGGINHTLYHGSNYTPKDAPWPGWLFYAAVHFSPNNSFYDDFPALNKYVAHAQSFLQKGKPDNDVLLYLPISDSYADRGPLLLKHYDGIERGFKGTVLEAAANELYDKGYAFDFISDKQILNTTSDGKLIHTANVNYQTILVPGADLMPLSTLQKLFQLANDGANITFYESLPKDVPGLSDLSNRQATFKSLIAQLNFKNQGDVKVAVLGKGKIMLSKELTALMNVADVNIEPMKAMGLSNIRRSYEGGKYYFIVNKNDTPIDGWFPIATKAASVAIFNPMTEKKGYAAIKSDNHLTMVYLQLQKGESCILQTFDQETHPADYAYFKVKDAAKPISGTWKINFTKGGPTLPASLETKTLKSWTEFGEDERKFSGTASYSIDFKRPKEKATAWQLDLGDVQESVKIVLNGETLATLIGPIYQVKIPSEKLKRKNHLELIVSNGMANRIHWMDETGQNYKIFYNTNFPAHFPQNRGADGLFTSKNWDIKPSGLMGPVQLIPLTVYQPER